MALQLRTLASISLLTAPFLLAATALHAQNQPEAVAPTLHSSAKLVVVDVVVTDKQHHPVHNLKQSDFSLLENKAPQAIKNFEEHLPVPAGTAIAPAQKLQPGIFDNDPGTVNGPANILLLDTLNTPVQDQIILRQQLLEYVTKSHTASRIAIFGLNTRLIVLQDFTSDPETLRKAIKSPATVKVSQVLDAPVSGTDLKEKFFDQLADDGNTTSATIAKLATFEATQQSLKLQTRTRLTLDNMNQLARYLIGMPGRKNVIWFSGSFPITIFPDFEHTDAAIQITHPNLASNGAPATAGNPFQGVASADKEFRETAALLAHSQVAIYPVQVKGLQTTAAFGAEAGGPTAPKYARNPNAFNVSQTADFTQTASADNTMLQLADETGGKAFLNSNGLADAVASAMDLGSSYYTLTYAPSGTPAKDAYRRIQVNLERQGYTLAYRHGYYAESSDLTPRELANPPSALEVAMEDGAPPATEIPLIVRVLPTSTDTEPSIAPGNMPNGSSKANKAPYRRFTVDYSADAHAIQFSVNGKGSHHAVLDFTVCVYTLSGELANAISKRVTIDLKPDQYAAMLKAGLSYYQQISVPAKGAFNLRIAIHDQIGDRIGSLEVPVASVKGLAPLAVAASH